MNIVMVIVSPFIHHVLVNNELYFHGNYIPTKIHGAFTESFVGIFKAVLIVAFAGMNQFFFALVVVVVLFHIDAKERTMQNVLSP